MKFLIPDHIKNFPIKLKSKIYKFIQHDIDESMFRKIFFKSDKKMALIQLNKKYEILGKVGIQGICSDKVKETDVNALYVKEAIYQFIDVSKINLFSVDIDYFKSPFFSISRFYSLDGKYLDTDISCATYDKNSSFPFPLHARMEDTSLKERILAEIEKFKPNNSIRSNLSKDCISRFEADGPKTG